MKVPSIAQRNLPRFLGALAAAAALILALGAGSASAAFSIEKFDGEAIADEAGDPAVQAGSHPYAMSIETQFSTEPGPFEIPVPQGPVKDQVVDLPAGLVGNPERASEVLACRLLRRRLRKHRLPGQHRGRHRQSRILRRPGNLLLPRVQHGARPR